MRPDDAGAASASRAHVVRRLCSAFCEADLPTLLETVDPDVEFEPVLGVLYSRHVFHGRGGIARRYEELRSDWDAFEIGVENTFGEGDRVVVLLHLVAHRGNERLDAEIGVECRLRGGRIRSMLGRDADDVADELAAGA